MNSRLKIFTLYFTIFPNTKKWSYFVKRFSLIENLRNQINFWQSVMMGTMIQQFSISLKLKNKRFVFYLGYGRSNS
jgi:hypothetical protein